MAKVIGKDETVARKCSCVGCGALVEYYKNDVSSRHYKDYDGGGDTQYWINCPGCSKRIIVKPWY